MSTPSVALEPQFASFKNVHDRIPIEMEMNLFQELPRRLPQLNTAQFTMITAYASDLNADALIEIFKSKIPPKVLVQRLHIGCDSCLQDRTLSASGDLYAVTLPETRERRAFACAEEYFTAQNDPNALYSFPLPGIEIIEKTNLLAEVIAPVVCFDIIFYHEPFFNAETGSPIFDKARTTDILGLLCEQGYSPSTTPRVGQVVVYSHGSQATHYARIESIDSKGRIKVISKFGNFHVYRHFIEVVPPSYGRITYYFDPPKPWLYTSPSTILNAQRSAKTTMGTQLNDLLELTSGPFLEELESYT